MRGANFIGVHKLLDKLVDKGILSVKEANELREEADKDFAKAYSVKSGMPDWVTALKLNGTTDCVDLGRWPGFNFPQSFSLSVWANIGAWHLNLWVHTLVELWAWNQPQRQICDRSASSPRSTVGSRSVSTHRSPVNRIFSAGITRSR